MGETISVPKEQLLLVMKLAGDRLNSEPYINYRWIDPRRQIELEDAYDIISDLLEESDNDTPTE